LSNVVEVQPTDGGALHVVQIKGEVAKVRWDRFRRVEPVARNAEKEWWIYAPLRALHSMCLTGIAD
jgi:hypothetical protein